MLKTSSRIYSPGWDISNYFIYLVNLANFYTEENKASNKEDANIQRDWLQNKHSRCSLFSSGSRGNAFKMQSMMERNIIHKRGRWKEEQISGAPNGWRLTHAHAHAHTRSNRRARFARAIGRRVRAALITFNYRESNGVSRPATIRPYFKFHWATWRRQFNFAPQSWPRKLSKPIIRSTRGPLACSRATGMKHGN